jgi:regulatory protein
MSAEEAKIINLSITRYLSRREHSYLELLQKLTQKGLDARACKKQLKLFVEQDIQSDSRYAQSMIGNAYSTGKGPQHIRQRLLQHNIESAEIESYLQDEAFDWYLAAQKVRSKKFGDELPDEFELKQKQKRFLQYRGFEQDHIKEVLD